MMGALLKMRVVDEPPVIDKPATRQSQINLAIPYDFDADSRIKECVDLLYSVVGDASDATEKQHDTVNWTVQQLLKFKFVIDTQLLTWMANTIFHVIFESKLHVALKAKYAETLTQLAKKLKKAQISLQVDANVIVNCLQAHFLSIQNRAMFKYEEDSFNAVCRAAKKCRPHLSPSSIRVLTETVANTQSLDQIQQCLLIRSLLCPEVWSDGDECLWKYTRRHNVQALTEMARVRSKKSPQSIDPATLSSLVDKCCEYVGLKRSEKGHIRKHAPYRGKLSHHLKLATGCFEDFPILIGDIFGNLLFRGNTEIDTYIQQFIHQFELVVYPGSGNKSLAENILKLMQRMYCKLAKRVDRKQLDKEQCGGICEIGVKYVTRAVFEKHIVNVMLCQGISRAIVHIDESVIMAPVIELFVECVSQESEPLRLPPSLALLTSIGAKMHANHGADLLELFPKIIDCIDPNDSYKTIGAASAIESITLSTEPGKMTWLAGCESDLSMYIWDKLESVLSRYIDNAHDELHPSDRNVLEFVLTASARFLGCMGGVEVLERVSDFLCDRNGFVIRKPFKQFILHFGRSGEPKNMYVIYKRVLGSLMDRLGSCKLERPFEDRCCDQEIWLMHVLAMLVRFSINSAISLPELDTIGSMIANTKNVKMAQAYGKLVKSVVKTIGTVYVKSIQSQERPCLLSDLTPQWFTPSASDIETCFSILKKACSFNITNQHCHATYLRYLLSGTMHFEAAIALLEVTNKCRYLVDIEEIVNQLIAKSIQKFTSKDVNSETRELSFQALYNAVYNHGVTSRKYATQSASFRIFSMMKKAYRGQKEIPMQLQYQRVIIHESLYRASLLPNAGRMEQVVCAMFDSLLVIPKSDLKFQLQVMSSFINEPTNALFMEKAFRRFEDMLNMEGCREDALLAIISACSNEPLLKNVGSMARIDFIQKLLSFVMSNISRVNSTAEVDQAIDQFGHALTKQCSFYLVDPSLLPIIGNPVAAPKTIQRLYVRIGRSLAMSPQIATFNDTLKTLLVESKSIDKDCCGVLADSLCINDGLLEIDVNEIFTIRCGVEDGECRFDKSIVSLYKHSIVKPDNDSVIPITKAQVNACLETIAASLPQLPVDRFAQIFKTGSVEKLDTLKAFLGELKYYRFEEGCLQSIEQLLFKADSQVVQSGLLRLYNAVLRSMPECRRTLSVKSIIEHCKMTSELLREPLSELLAIYFSQGVPVDTILLNNTDAVQLLCDAVCSAMPRTTIDAVVVLFECSLPIFLRGLDSPNNIVRRSCEDSFMQTISSLHGSVDSLFTIFTSLSQRITTIESTRVQLRLADAMVTLNGRHFVFVEEKAKLANHTFTSLLSLVKSDEIRQVLLKGIIDYFIGRPLLMDNLATKCQRALYKSSKQDTEIMMAKALMEAADFRMFPWIPKLQSALARHVNAPAPMGDLVKRSFMDFKRKHHDTWHRDRLMYTAEDFEVVSDLLVSPSYYV